MAKGRLPLVSVAALLVLGLNGLARTEPLPTGATRSQQAQATQIDHAPGERIDSAVCGSCHTDIYDAWNGSVHAQAYRDPVFQQGLAQAINEVGPEIATTCLACHSPASTKLTKQYPEQSMEGVGCQFCHIIRGRDATQMPPYDLDHNLVMYGPYADAESPVHQTVFSDFMSSAEYCAGCHEFRGPSGAHVLSTFSEYESGSYPGLTQCQGCHMPLVPGFTVDPAVQETDRGRWVDYHGIEGGRDIDQLRRSVGVEVVSADKSSASVNVEVAITNRAAGHWLPTGMPSRRMVLEVSTRWAERRQSRSVVFGRSVVDADGGRIRDLAAMILRGARVVNDTRLRPRQRRTFDFTLPAPVGADVRLVVRLYYESSELPEVPPVTRDIVHLERTLD